jgi:copper(I)-binding protein
MTRSIRSTVLRSGAALTATLLAAGIAAAPAQAHETPKLGSTCALSGTIEIDHGDVYVCVSRTEGAKPRWGKALPISRAAITLSDGWAKAADSGMSAAFGMVKNPTAKPVRVIGAYSSYAKAVQLHEVVDKSGSMVMQQKAGGFLIPAGGMLELKPGGNHLMFMGLTKPITAGMQIPVTLITADGGLQRVKVLAKVYTGANETYMSGM